MSFILRTGRFLRVDMDGLGSRIKIAADNIGGLDALAAKLEDTSRRTLSDWANDKTEPRASALAEICTLTGCRIDWLVMGRNATTSQDDAEEQARQSLSAVTKRQADAPIPHDSGMIRLPVLRAEAAVASASSTSSVDQVAFDAEFLQDLGTKPGDCAIFWVKGDSMSPAIPAGSMLIVDVTQCEINSGCLYLIEVVGELLVKRVRRHLDGAVDLLSDNALYPAEKIPYEDLSHLQVAGRVVYFGRTP